MSYFKTRWQHLCESWEHARHHGPIAAVTGLVIVWGVASSFEPLISHPEFPKLPLSWAVAFFFAALAFVILEGSYRKKVSVDNCPELIAETFLVNSLEGGIRVSNIQGGTAHGLQISIPEYEGWGFKFDWIPHLLEGKSADVSPEFMHFRDLVRFKGESSFGGHVRGLASMMIRVNKFDKKSSIKVPMTIFLKNSQGDGFATEFFIHVDSRWTPTKIERVKTMRRLGFSQ